MYKHYVGIAVCSVLVLITAIIGFTIVGSPAVERGINLDKARIADFTNIQSRIESYYITNHKFPDFLSDLDGKPNIKDPETHKEYGFEKGTNGAYKLCATFSTDSSVTDKTGDTQTPTYLLSTSTTTNKHKKGDDCMNYTIPSYYMSNPLQTTSSTYAGNIYATPTPAYAEQAQIAANNNTKRSSDVYAILNAVTQWSIDNKGAMLGEISSDSARLIKAPDFESMCAILVPTYVAALPVDPAINSSKPVTASDCSGSSWNTGYTIQRVTGSNRIRVHAPAAEAGATIEAER